MSQIMSLYNLSVERDTVCTIGNFDGLHIGHQKIINILKEDSQKYNLSSALITFYPHPKKVLSPGNFSCSIVNLETKLFLLKQYFIEYILVVDFNQRFYQKSPKEFMDFLRDKLRCRRLIVGKDWRFGRDKEGDVTFAREYGRYIGIDVETIEDVLVNGERTSSTRIRGLLSEGKIRQVKDLLGRDYFLRERVVRGNQLGRTIGFPTINLKPQEDLCLRKGVYAGFVKLKDSTFPAVINYGYRPTVDGKTLFMEVHITSEFNEDVKENSLINVYFVEFIREEKRFENIDKLKEQIQLDILQSKEVLSYVEFSV